MARTSERVGRGPCPHCSSPVTFYRTKGGLLNYECDADDCGHSTYAHKGSRREAEWLASIEKPASPASAPVAATAPASAAPAVTPNKTFTMGL